MEKKFIKKEDLGEIVSQLVEKIADHVDEIRTEICIEKDYKGEEVLSVRTSDKHYRRLMCQEYIIIDQVKDWIDVSDECVASSVEMLDIMKQEDAIKAEAEAEAKAKAEAEENEEESNN